MKASPSLPLPAARFSVVVTKCGRPAVHLTLMNPAKDPELLRLEKQSRVLTLFRAHRGAGADYGLVGLHVRPRTQLLVFPKSLRRFAGKRVVGVNYELLDEIPQVSGNISLTKRKSRDTPPAGTTPKPEATSTPMPEPKLVAFAPEPPRPLTLNDVLGELRSLDRLLRAKKYAPAREATRRLVQRLGRESESAN